MKKSDHKVLVVRKSQSQENKSTGITPDLKNNRSEAVSQRRAREMADNSEQVKGQSIIQKMADDHLNSQKLSVSHSSEQPVQLKFRQGNKNYSFLSAHDFNGNPYLASNDSGVAKNYKISSIQTGVQMEEVNDLHEEVTDQNRERVFHNLSHGREQRITAEGQKAILNPFKSYQFGVEKLPDVAVFNVGHHGVERGKLYKDYFKMVESTFGTYQMDRDYEEALKALAVIRSEMMPLIIAEDYRTQGAIKVFNVFWQNMLVGFKNYKNEVNVASLMKPAVKLATTNLPWAGTGGKNKFRESNPDHHWEESSRNIGRREMSPEKDSRGGQWEKDMEY